MAEIIDLQAHLKKREADNISNLKKELEIEIQKLDYDIEKELSKFVIFDTSMYYNISKEENNTVSKDNAVKQLFTAFEMLVKLNKDQAAIDIKNVITRLENDSY